MRWLPMQQVMAHGNPYRLLDKATSKFYNVYKTNVSETFIYTVCII